MGTDLRGRPVRERAVRLGEIGLFAITTEPDGGGSGPWMMFLNVATEHHIGPGRLWVDLARQWARHGIRSVRFDISGVGDSPVHPGQTESVTYARELFDDLPELASGVSPDDPSDTVFIGLCSGGYGALEAAMALGARGAYVFNPAPVVGEHEQVVPGGRPPAPRLPAAPGPLGQAGREARSDGVVDLAHLPPVRGLAGPDGSPRRGGAVRAGCVPHLQRR